ncbi:DUF3570 domain-containing protein [Thiorhodococcus minor]|uniref:DUF3570 domain-containing protein n=1 Tax=Thiorhodococcus minor TaxID=57489 RepID=A0A6M0JYI9_9GAMM|nr:DUF3570 domain-containing protein [Thiorhodococcus minor]
MAATDQPPSKTLTALTSAALALPGMPQTGVAATPEERDWEVGYFYYEEGDDRMTVESLNQSLVVPLGDRLDIRLNGVRDTISGASPIYNVPQIRCEDGRVFDAPVRTVSGASGSTSTGGPPPERPPLNDGSCGISSVRQVMLESTFEDIRTAGDFKLSYYRDDTTLSFGAGLSREKDYDSDFFSLDLRQEMNQKLTTLAVGYSLASDTFTPLNKTNFSGDKETHQLLVGVTQVLSKNDFIQANLTYGDSSGYLTDPYKNVYLLSTNEAIEESRPEARRQWNLLTRYVHYFPGLKSALHLDYRYSRDDWGISAHTVETFWIQSLGQGWQLVPRLRYYSQGQADFYQSYFEDLPADGYYSSDYRLAGFGALSGALKLTKQITDQVRLDAGVEFYDRQSHYALNDHDDSSYADYGFTIYSLSVDFAF